MARNFYEIFYYKWIKLWNGFKNKYNGYFSSLKTKKSYLIIIAIEKTFNIYWKLKFSKH